MVLAGGAVFDGRGTPVAGYQKGSPNPLVKKKPQERRGACPGARGSTHHVCYRASSLTHSAPPHKERAAGLYLQPYDVPWGGRRFLTGEVPLYLPWPERAPRLESLRVEKWRRCHYLEVMPRGYVASRPPSDMPSTPAALSSPLAAAASSGFRVSRSINHHPRSSACDPW